jgi:hypothetical protein
LRLQAPRAAARYLESYTSARRPARVSRELLAANGMSSFLFTFVLEFGGGTYVAQYRGRTPRQALSQWARRESELLPSRSARLAAAAFASTGDLAPLENVVNAWCASTIVGKKLALLNVIKTAE